LKEWKAVGGNYIPEKVWKYEGERIGEYIWKEYICDKI